MSVCVCVCVCLFFWGVEFSPRKRLIGLWASEIRHEHIISRLCARLFLCFRCLLRVQCSGLWTNSGRCPMAGSCLGILRLCFQDTKTLTLKPGPLAKPKPLRWPCLPLSTLPWAPNMGPCLFRKSYIYIYIHLSI